LLAELEHLVHWIDDEQPCDALVFGLCGQPVGCAPEAPDSNHVRKWEKLMIRIDRLACVSVAALDGPCVGFAMQLALACDHRVATTRTRFQIVELKHGYLPGMNVFRLSKYVGLGVARRLIFTGEPLDGPQAAALGVIDVLCEPDALAGALEHFLARLEPIHPTPIKLARRLLGESFASEFEQFLGHYLASQHTCLADLQRQPSPGSDACSAAASSAATRVP
jgi:enoyl-CoA hydratase/carnithine racemase